MRNFINKAFVCLTIISSIVFSSCSDSGEILEELSISEKVGLLEKGEWLLKGFEDRVMHTFVDGKRHTYYGQNNVFSNEAIPGTQEYKIEGNLLTIDYNFGNISTYELKFSCDNTIVEFYKNGQLGTTLYKRGSSYKDCI